MGKLVNKKELCEIIGRSEQMVTKWQKEGLPIEVKRGSGRKNSYDTAKVFDWILGNQSKKNLSELEIERTRLTKLQADRQELEIKVMEGELLKIEDVTNSWSKILNDLKSKLLGLPSRASTLLQGVITIQDTKKILDKLIKELLNEIANTKTRKRKNSKSDE